MFGNNFRSRMSGRIVGFSLKAALLAASPAFAEGSKGTWAEAADYNGEILDLIGGAAGLAAQGNTWYKNADEINSLTGVSNPPGCFGEMVGCYSLFIRAGAVPTQPLR